MNRTWLAICGMIAAVSLQSCDSGDIYPAEDPSAMTRTLDIRGTFTGNNTVPSDRDRKLMVFTYPDGSGESNRSVRINSIGDGETTVSVSLVPSNASNFVMAITDQGNSVMYEICSGKFETGTADAEVDVGNVDMLAYNRLQTQLYDQSCTSCHGSANPSAGLVLDAGVSHMNTVNHATANGSGTIIKPFDIPASVMASKLGDPDDFHSRLSTLKANDTELLRAWILAGAKSD